VQAHTLGEVGILGIVLLRAYSGTILPIFIQIGSYLTDKEQKISWHSFFWDTVYYMYLKWTFANKYGFLLQCRQLPVWLNGHFPAWRHMTTMYGTQMNGANSDVCHVGANSSMPELSQNFC